MVVHSGHFRDHVPRYNHMLYQFSELSFMHYMRMYVVSLPISLLMIVRIHVHYLIITESEV